MTEETPCVVARFEDYHAFVEALRALKESGVYRYEAYGPTNLDRIEDLMAKKGSGVRIWSTFGALVGLATFWLVCVLSALIYAIIVGGKPPISNIPYVIPAYEGTILLGGIAAFIAILAYARFGPRKPPAYYDPRFSGDSYGIAVLCKGKEKARVAEMLSGLGAVDTKEVEA
ncbi:MAG: DUF3341 domain-containing protein [Armatimonadota bacterium]|nr:DUF3341 domain-containing protein [Armatimonadota bacterium]